MKPPRPAKSPLRKHWSLDPRVVFLNHGSFGACPKVVLRHQAELRGRMEAEPLQFLWRNHDAMLHDARVSLARFLGVKTKDLVFTTNATTAVNAVVRSWPLKRGDEILTTNFDYNACRNVLAEAARKAGAKVIVAEIPFPIRSADVVVERVLSAVTSRTRFAMLDHVTSNTALVIPVARIARELEQRGVRVLIDGAHAPGMLPLNPSKLHASWYTGNLHKWVCAPKGAAFLWAREDSREFLQPAVISHGNNSHRDGFEAWQDRFDWPGTFDSTAWFSVPKAIETIGNILPSGWPEVREHSRALVLSARRMLCESLGVEAPCPASMIGSMATIPLPARFQKVVQPDRIVPEYVRLFEEYGIEVPFVKIGDLRCFRISAHLHNSAEEYVYLAEAIKRL